MARGLNCAGHTHRTLVPIEVHHLQPLSRGGPNTDDNKRAACGNLHGNIHYLLDLIEDHAILLMHRPEDGDPSPRDCWLHIPQPIRDTYSPDERRLALLGWNRYAADFLAGRYLRTYIDTVSSGAPRD
jgi:hypothetical protein